MLEAISNALDEADKDKQARVIVLSGNGPVFSSGHDLKEMTASRNSNLGLFCSTPMVALSRNVSNKHALEMLLTGEPCSAQKAVEIGLINKAVAQDDQKPMIIVHK